MDGLKVDQLEFVFPPSEFLHTKCAGTECSVLLEEPRLTSCCGNHFCQACIEALSDGPCPLCGESFLSVPDKNLQRAISSCRVRCLKKNEGCKWEGELRHLREHLSATGDCQFVVVPCSHGCGFSALRPLLSNHELCECPKRPVYCRYCVEFRSPWETVQEHEQVCPEALVTCPNECDEKVKRSLLSAHVAECPLQEVTCEFAYIGCNWSGVRRNQELHLQDHWKDHIIAAMAVHSQTIKSHESTIALLTQEVDNQEQHITALADWLTKLQMESSAASETGDDTSVTSVGTHELVVRRLSIRFFAHNFAEEKNNQDGHCKVQTFFTGNPGYRMRVRVYLGGKGSGLGTHISVFTTILNGPSDDQLVWPFYGSVTVRLCSWHDKTVFCQKVIYYGKNVALEHTRQTFNWGDSTTEWGIEEFIAHNEVNAYLQDDSLLFELREVTVPCWYL